MLHSDWKQWVAIFALSGVCSPGLSAHEVSNSQSMTAYHHAWQLIGQHDEADAIPLLKAIISEEGDFYRAYKSLVEAYAQTNKLDEAESYLFSLLKASPSPALAHYGLGELYRTRGQRSLAAEEYSICIRKSPEAHPCYIALVDALAQSSTPVAQEEIDKRLPAEVRRPYSLLAHARLQQINRRFQEAAEAAQTGLRETRAVGEHPELEAGFLRILVEIHNSSSQWNSEGIADADQLLQHVRRLNDWQAEFDARNFLATAYGSLRDYDHSLQALQANVEFASQTGHGELAVTAQDLLGRYHESRANFSVALQCWQEAVRLRKEMHSSSTNLLLEIGTLQRKMGSFVLAKESFEAAAHQATAYSDRFGEARALRSLGSLTNALGEYFQALDYHSRSVQILRELGESHFAGAGIGNIGIIFANLGDYETARSYFEQSLQSGREFKDMGEQIRNLECLAELYARMEKPRQSLRYLAEAMKLSRQAESVRGQPVLFINFGSAYGKLNQYHKALGYFQEGARLAHESGDKSFEAQALSAIGDCYLHLDRIEMAEQYYGMALNAAQSMDLTEAVIYAQRGLGRLRKKQGNYNGAIQEFQKAINIIESVRGTIRAASLKASFVKQNWHIYEDMVDVLFRLHQREPVKGYDQRAFLVAEKGRARAFLDTLSESQVKITKGLTQEQLNYQESLFQELAKQDLALRQGNPAASGPSVYKAEQALSDWVVELKRTNPIYQELHYPVPSQVHEVQALAADERAAVLEYMLGEDHSYAWIITARNSGMIVLPPRKTIESAVLKYRQMISRRPLTNADYLKLVDASRQLYRWLIEPTKKYLKGEHNLIVIPDGILFYLPFETLAQGSRVAPATGVRYLVEDYGIVYAPSVSVWCSLRERNHQRQGISQEQHELVAYGDPLFASGPSSRPAAAGGSSRKLGSLVRGVYVAAGMRFEQLPNTRVEVQAIGRLFSPAQRKINLGVQASEASVKHEKLVDYKRIHFATHALIDDRIPARSGLVLSVVNQDQEDGILNMNEIFNLDLDADLVVLSACRTGLGKLQQGEGMIGLTRAFLYAGASRVVVSLWDVNDFSTAEFMATFYREMKKTKNIHQALRVAKIKMIHSATSAYQHPYFWAPFIQIGLQ